MPLTTCINSTASVVAALNSPSPSPNPVKSNSASIPFSESRNASFNGANTVKGPAEASETVSIHGTVGDPVSACESAATSVDNASFVVAKVLLFLEVLGLLKSLHHSSFFGLGLGDVQCELVQSGQGRNFSKLYSLT